MFVSSVEEDVYDMTAVLTIEGLTEELLAKVGIIRFCGGNC